MVKYVLLGALGIGLVSFLTNGKGGDHEQAIRAIIQTAYVEGLQNEGDSVKIDKGFHPQFQMIARGKEDALRLYAIKDWRKSSLTRRKEGKLPRPAYRTVSLKFDFVDVTGDAAVAKVRYFEGTEHTYTDYITLYKFGKDWKLVSKAFYRVGD